MATAVQKIASLSNIRDIPFNKLVLSQANVRRVKGAVSIDDLAESIAHRGLLQNLNVRPVVDAEGQETGVFEVPAGGRRFRALELLVLGYKLVKAGRHLQSFAHFAAERGDAHIRTATALAWVAAAGQTQGARDRRLVDVALFARFLHAEDDRHEVPPSSLFAARRSRPIPYIYTRTRSPASSTPPASSDDNGPTRCGGSSTSCCSG